MCLNVGNRDKGTVSVESKLLFFSCPVVSISLWPCGLQYATRPLCPSLSPKVCPSSCPLHQWYPSWTTAFSWWKALHNSVKLWAMPCRATQDGLIIAESSEKMCSTGWGRGQSPQYTCCENLMNGIKGIHVSFHLTQNWWPSSTILPIKMILQPAQSGCND